MEYQSKNQLSVSNGDAVWVVADGDVNYNTPDPIAAKDKLLSKAQKMADAKGIHIALSNPCFEFWYLLHFQYTTKFFKDYPAVKNALTAYIPDYEKTGDVYSQLSGYTADALQNAKRVEQYHLQNGSSKSVWNRRQSIHRYLSTGGIAAVNWHGIVPTLAQPCP